jgi:hypothetical protein
MILNCLLEGNSVRGTARLCSVEKRTVLSILNLAGRSCERLFREHVLNVSVKDLEFDEVWSYVGSISDTSRQRKRVRTSEMLTRSSVWSAHQSWCWHGILENETAKKYSGIHGENSLQHQADLT